MADKKDPQAIVGGLRSGNGYVVEGDLINDLDFTAQFHSAQATMGQTLPVTIEKGNKSDSLKLTIRFRSPARNNHGEVGSRLV